MIEQYMRQYRWAEVGKRPVWMLVTKDKYQLPLAVAETAEELAQIVGVRKSTIRKSVTRRKKSKYIRVYVDMEDDE